MNKKKINYFANKLVNAFLKDKIISPILCESKIKKPIIGFKEGGTAIPVLKKLNEKEPFYAAVYKHNFLKNNKSVKINRYALGIELEVCFLIKKEFFNLKKNITFKNIGKYTTHMAPCIEIVGYRQRKKGIKYLGDLCSDFGANVKFIIGAKKKFRKINIGDLKTNISNKRVSQSINGNTNTVYINPINSLKFVLNKLIKEKVKLNNDFYVFTGSTVGVVPILGKGLYLGKIEKLGSVKTRII